MRVIGDGCFGTAGPVVSDGLRYFMFIPAHLVSSFHDQHIYDSEKKPIGTLLWSCLELDIALVQLDTSFEFERHAIGKPCPGEAVHKTGESTGGTNGKICRTTDLFVFITSEDSRFAVEGDSGSAVFTGGLMVGMLLRQENALWVAINIHVLMELVPFSIETLYILKVQLL